MKELNLLYVHGSSIGYGRYGVQLANALRQREVDVFDHLPGTNADGHYLDDHLNQGYQSKVCNTVAWVSVPTHARGWHKGQNPVISTMWESGSLPESFRESLHNFSTVIVPSFQNVELFSQYHDNVHFVPLGVDPVAWQYRERRPPATTFDFLIGGSGLRKGTDLAHKAFRKLWGKEGSWGDGPIPQLIMKNPRGESFYGERVIMVSGRISDQDEIDLYANAHCYLQPSRGEGFGLQPLQAIAQGLPTILTAAHGHDSFAQLGIGIGSKREESAYFIYGDAGEWWEPNFDELCDQMLWVYNHYDEAATQAARNSELARNIFSWENCANEFVKAIGEDQLSVPYSGSGEWFTPDLKRYKVITNRDWTADIAGVTYHFTKGKSYYELSDVKRILFEGQLLDPACLDDVDSGLTESQVAKIGEYTAANSNCLMCGQPLNTEHTKADNKFDELELAAKS